MPGEEILSGMEALPDATLELILQDLMRKDESIKLKTHIIDPSAMSALGSIKALCEKSGLKVSAAILGEWIENFEQYMVSWRRQGRQEILKAISRMLTDDTKDTLEKLFAKNA